jgi:hypothetical protein
VLKWFALWVPIPWRGYKVIPELDQQIGGTSPVEFKADVRARLFVMLLRLLATAREMGARRSLHSVPCFCAIALFHTGNAPGGA